MIEGVESREEIAACFGVIKQLRPHLTEGDFVDQVLRQRQNHGYVLVALKAEGAVRAAAGYRLAEFLAWGRALYVDDLITDETARGRGFAGQLMDWLVAKARTEGCAEFHLDSGVHRFDAHRLYLKKKMIISSHHFSMKLD